MLGPQPPETRGGVKGGRAPLTAGAAADAAIGCAASGVTAAAAAAALPLSCTPLLPGMAVSSPAEGAAVQEWWTAAAAQSAGAPQPTTHVAQPAWDATHGAWKAAASFLPGQQRERPGRG